MKAKIASIRHARQIREVFKPVMPGLDEVETFFEKELEQALPMVRKVAGYVLLSGGKRLRPALVLLIAKMLGYEGERAVRYGAIVELIHTATLIHDDIIDESDLRRGKPTANNKWNNQTCVLVGDWLYSRTMDLCLEFGDVEVMRKLTTATLRMTEGEILADLVQGDPDLDEERYFEITRRKTAELFAAACALPALFQSSTLHFTENLMRYGRSLGLCFQLIDDLLDFTADRSELGKPVMADLRERRVTLPTLLLLPRLDPRRRDALREVVRSGRFEAISEAEVLELVKTSGVLDETRQRASDYADQAVEATASMPEGPERDGLALAAQLLLERKR